MTFSSPHPRSFHRHARSVRYNSESDYDSDAGTEQWPRRHLKGITSRNRARQEKTRDQKKHHDSRDMKGYPSEENMRAMHETFQSESHRARKRSQVSDATTEDNAERLVKACRMYIQLKKGTEDREELDSGYQSRRTSADSSRRSSRYRPGTPKTKVSFSPEYLGATGDSFDDDESDYEDSGFQTSDFDYGDSEFETSDDEEYNAASTSHGATIAEEDPSRKPTSSSLRELILVQKVHVDDLEKKLVDKKRDRKDGKANRVGLPKPYARLPIRPRVEQVKGKDDVSMGCSPQFDERHWVDRRGRVERRRSRELSGMRTPTITIGSLETPPRALEESARPENPAPAIISSKNGRDNDDDETSSRPQPSLPFKIRRKPVPKMSKDDESLCNTNNNEDSVRRHQQQQRASLPPRTIVDKNRDNRGLSDLPTRSTTSVGVLGRKTPPYPVSYSSSSSSHPHRNQNPSPKPGIISPPMVTLNDSKDDNDDDQLIVHHPEPSSLLSSSTSTPPRVVVTRAAATTKDKPQQQQQQPPSTTITAPEDGGDDAQWLLYPTYTGNGTIDPFPEEYQATFQKHPPTPDEERNPRLFRGLFPHHPVDEGSCLDGLLAREKADLGSSLNSSPEPSLVLSPLSPPLPDSFSPPLAVPVSRRRHTCHRVTKRVSTAGKRMIRGRSNLLRTQHRHNHNQLLPRLIRRFPPPMRLMGDGSTRFEKFLEDGRWVWEVVKCRQGMEGWKELGERGRDLGMRFWERKVDGWGWRDRV